MSEPYRLKCKCGAEILIPKVPNTMGQIGMILRQHAYFSTIHREQTTEMKNDIYKHLVIRILEKTSNFNEEVRNNNADIRELGEMDPWVNTATRKDIWNAYLLDNRIFGLGVWSFKMFHGEKELKEPYNFSIGYLFLHFDQQAVEDAVAKYVKDQGINDKWVKSATIEFLDTMEKLSIMSCSWT